MSTELAKQKVLEGKNIFVTGSAGVGKSWLNHELKTNNTVIVAPTGIAALNAGGATCHKIFSLPLGTPTQKDWDIMPRKVTDLFGKYSKVDAIHFDEIGMIRADTLELIDHRLKKARGNNLPFGGFRVTGFGDFFQLPPIVARSEAETFYSRWDSPYCFNSKAWIFETVLLEKVYRQSDERQVRMLNSIRVGDKHAELAIQRIREESRPYKNCGDTLHLCCYRNDADRINDLWFTQLDTPVVKFYGVAEGEPHNWEETPVGLEVELRIGARVLICANSPGHDYVNGDRGHVKEWHEDGVIVRLEKDGTDVFVEPAKWEKYEYINAGGNVLKAPVSTLVQIPLQLGWAVTVHKSQGLTLDNVALDTGRGCFSHGQLYVALSRIRDLKNISLVRPISKQDLIVDKEVVEWYRKLKGN